MPTTRPPEPTARDLPGALLALAVALPQPWTHDPADRPPGRHRAPGAGLRWVERLALAWPRPPAPAPAPTAAPAPEPIAAPPELIEPAAPPAPGAKVKRARRPPSTPATAPVCEPAPAEPAAPPAPAPAASWPPLKPVQWAALLAALAGQMPADPVAAGLVPKPRDTMADYLAALRRRYRADGLVDG